MTTPRDPRHGGADDVERRLRESLAHHAARAPEGDMLAERIIHAAGRRGAAPERQRFRWLAPVAAAAVLIVLAGVVLAVTQFRSSDHTPAADTAGPTVSSLPTASPSDTPAPTPSVRRSGAVSSSARTTVPDPTLTNVRFLDLTFTGTDSGWALGTADCLDGSGRICTALLHTSDGRTWQARGGAQFNVAGVSAGCATRCVTNIRFADDDTGYAYGPSAFFMTTDGGQSWKQQSGGALALETLDGNVVRVTSSGNDCPGPCNIGVQTAPIGSTTWTTRDLGSAPSGSTTAAYLSRGGSDVYLLVTANPAGGANNETSTLYRSTDDGTSWRNSGEPCPQVGGENDSSAVAAAADGRVAVLCRIRGTELASVAVSTNHGASFRTTRGAVPGATAGLLTGDASTVLLTGGTGVGRSTDGGGSWTTVTDVTGKIDFVGFESKSVARAVTDGGRLVWTTRDGGRNWTRLALG